MKLFTALILFANLSFSAPEIGYTKYGFSAPSLIGTGTLNALILVDDQALDPNGVAIINVDSDNAASALRSIVILPGNVVGQKVRITCRPAGGNSQIDDDTVIAGGLIKLVNNWVCNQDGNSINLFWNGSDWEEDGRVNL